MKLEMKNIEWADTTLERQTSLDYVSFLRGDWSDFEEANNTQTKWQEFIKMYKVGVRKWRK